MSDLVVHWPAWAETLDGVLAVARSQDRLREWVEAFGLLAPLVFFLAEAAQVVFSPVPGSLLPPVGALAFGPWMALALSLGGCAAGAAVVFALARRCGRPLIHRLVTPSAAERYSGVLTSRGGLWLFLVFAIPFLPGDAVCALAGLSSVSFRRFLTVSTLGRVPSTALAIALAAELSAAPAWAVPAVALAVAAGLTLAFGYRRRVEAWLLRVATDGEAAGAQPPEPHEPQEPQASPEPQHTRRPEREPASAARPHRPQHGVRAAGSPSRTMGPPPAPRWVAA